MGKVEDKVNSLTGMAGNVIGGVQLVKDLFTSRRKQDARQVEQQGKLNAVNARTAKELADYEQKLKMKMWQDTNYTAQLSEATKAGVSKVAAIGGGGAGVGQGASVGSVSGTGAADAAATQNANTSQLMATAQIANLNADTKKKEVEAGKLGGVDTESATEDVVGKKFNNALNATLKETLEGLKINEGVIKGIEAEEKNASWETKKSVGYESGDFKDVNNRIAKQMTAEMEMEAEKLKNAKKAGSILDAEKIIKDFEAELTKEGIAPNSPFYVKIMGDLLGKIGLNPIKAIGGGK